MYIKRDLKLVHEHKCSMNTNNQLHVLYMYMYVASIKSVNMLTHNSILKYWCYSAYQDRLHLF